MLTLIHIILTLIAIALIIFVIAVICCLLACGKASEQERQREIQELRLSNYRGENTYETSNIN